MAATIDRTAQGRIDRERRRQERRNAPTNLQVGDGSTPAQKAERERARVRDAGKLGNVGSGLAAAYRGMGTAAPSGVSPGSIRGKRSDGLGDVGRFQRNTTRSTMASSSDVTARLAGLNKAQLTAVARDVGVTVSSRSTAKSLRTSISGEVMRQAHAGSKGRSAELTNELWGGKPKAGPTTSEAGRAARMKAERSLLATIDKTAGSASTQKPSAKAASGSVADLRAAAKAAGIKGTSKMKKADLVSALSKRGQPKTRQALRAGKVNGSLETRTNRLVTAMMGRAATLMAARAAGAGGGGRSG